MNTPNHNEAGLIAAAITIELIDQLQALGVLTFDARAAILHRAGERLKNIHTGNGDMAAAWLAAEAAKPSN